MHTYYELVEYLLARIVLLVEYQPARQGDTGWDNGRHTPTDRAASGCE